MQTDKQKINIGEGGNEVKGVAQPRTVADVLFNGWDIYCARNNKELSDQCQLHCHISVVG